MKNEICCGLKFLVILFGQLPFSMEALMIRILPSFDRPNALSNSSFANWKQIKRNIEKMRTNRNQANEKKGKKII